MKKILLACILALGMMFGTENASAQGVSFGAHGIYDIDLESFGVGGQVRTGLPLGGLPFILNPSLEYYFVDDIGDVNVTHFRVNADLLYPIGTENVAVFLPYVGAGLGVHRTSADVDTEVGEFEGSSTDLGLNLVAGANFGVGSSIVPFAQAALWVGDGSAVGIKVGILFGQ